MHTESRVPYEFELPHWIARGGTEEHAVARFIEYAAQARREGYVLPPRVMELSEQWRLDQWTYGTTAPVEFVRIEH